MRYVSVVLAIVLAYAAQQYLKRQFRVTIQPHLLHHKTTYHSQLLSASTGDALHELLLSLGTRAAGGYSSNVNDGLLIKHEHVGEAEPIEPDGSCKEKFLVPSVDKDKCILPGRVDIGRHYVLTGGLEGLRENFDQIVSRVQSFGVYNFDLDKYDIIRDLFASEHFQRVAMEICPADKQVLDPFQFNFILQLPGQTVPLHLDAPYFFGASRFQFPQWLLVSMVFSDLFRDRFVDQVQVVGYLHKFDAAGRGGEFVAFTEGAEEEGASVVPSTSFSGTAVDGSKTVHAARQYMPESPLPLINKDKNNKLVYLGEEKWALESDGEKIGDYTTNDIRMTIVYRSRCFSDEKDRERFGSEQKKAKKKEAYEGMLELDDILNTFAADLVKRGKVASVEQALAMKRLKFATLILDTYVRYPTNMKRIVPINYCLVTKQFPALTPLFKMLGC